jgi:WW domain-containing oxidoreductase
MLLPVLQRTSGSRLVLQSSDLHRGCPSSTEFTAVQEINTDIGPMNLYNRTKLAQILTVRALVQRMENSKPGFQTTRGMGPWINATHPGGVKTDQQQQAIDAYGTMGKIGVNAIQPFLKDPVDEGCRSALFAATSEDVVKEGIQGQYVCFGCCDEKDDVLIIRHRSFRTVKSRSLRTWQRTWRWEKTFGA